MKILTLLILGLFSATSSQSQHHNFWMRTTLHIPVEGQVSSELEFQHRRQNGFENRNRCAENLMYTYRNWFHYDHSEDIRFSISPFAYFSHFKIIEGENDVLQIPSEETRFSAAIHLSHKLFNRVHFIDRSALEYRIIEGWENNITRLRNRLGLRYEISKKMKLLVYDEIFLNMGGVASNHFFDQDRIGVNLEYHVLSSIKVELGFMHLSRLPLFKEEKLKEDNLVLNFTYTFE